MPIVDRDKLAERARQLGAQDNGMRRVLVTLAADAAKLEVEFWNANGLTALLADTRAPDRIFPIAGGHRLRADASAGFVRVEQIAPGRASTSLVLTVRPIGDYSTYTLTLDAPHIDPVFKTLPFKFRPGCFSGECASMGSPGSPKDDPPIDRLAKDYESFRHALIAAVGRRVPGWTPTSEADLTVTLIDLFAGAADELSDYQDRVMNEAYLTTARNRVSLARHARLVDYHIDQGSQAETWLALTLVPNQDLVLAPGFLASAGDARDDPHNVAFLTRDAVAVSTLANSFGLYTWGDTQPALARGDTSADLLPTIAGQAAADAIRDRVRDGRLPRLLLQEQKNPATGREPDRDVRKRCLLRLTGADSLQDPMTSNFVVRVTWQPEDALTQDYCFVAFPTGLPRVGDVSQFFGNLVRAAAGARANVTFREPGSSLAVGERTFERTPWGTLCRLPEDAPVAYRQRPNPEMPPLTTLAVTVTPPAGAATLWDERISLVHSRDTDPHFMVETDELARSVIRFGAPRAQGPGNGQVLPDDAIVTVHYQTGRGLDGNVGRDSIVNFDSSAGAVETCWNPFDVVNGTAPEPRDEIVRNAPEAFRSRQLRAVTLSDYVARAEEVDGVARAAARYAWTGSWRTVQVAIDPDGAEILSDDLRERVATHLEVVRLIGEDVELREPEYVPARIEVVVCVAPDVWTFDAREALTDEFTSGLTADGRLGFFHPDRWTFGQALYRSQIEGAILRIPGIDHVVEIDMRRFDAPTPGVPDPLTMAPNEILRVRNDPDQLELGSIAFDLRGGRG